jgi:hypothetical protein
MSEQRLTGLAKQLFKIPSHFLLRVLPARECSVGDEFPEHLLVVVS